MENSMHVPQKIKNRSYGPAFPLLGIYQKEMKSLFQRDICTPCSLQQPKCPLTDEWIKRKKRNVHNGILFSHKRKEGKTATCNNMDEP